MKSELITKDVLRAPQRGLLRAVGCVPEDFDKPFIGVINSYSEIVAGHMHLRSLAQSVKDGVRSCGGVPFEVNTIAVCDAMGLGNKGMKYSLPSRELTADSIEIIVEAHPFDGLVFIPSCDKVVPGMLLAAVRLNLPCIFISGGPMMAGNLCKGGKVQKIDDTAIFEAVGTYLIGEMSLAELTEIEEYAYPGCGSCAGMYTANTMNCLTEALGLALPGNGTIPAPQSRRILLAYRSGQQVMDVVAKNILPKEIVTKSAITNAFVVTMAVGGSTNSTIHLPALAHEAGFEFPLSQVNDISDKVPHICKLLPSGSYYMEDLDMAGGIPAVMKEISAFLDLNAKTILGKPLRDIVEKAEIKNREVIHEVSNPYRPTGGLTIMYGNLAPEGAVIKSAGVAPELMIFRGPARVFDSEEEAVEAISQKKFKSGDVIVIRYEGPKGGPGAREMLTPTSILCGMGMDKEIAVITDGRLSGTCRGPVAAHISPEAAARGPLAALKDGDMIVMDIPKRKLDVELSTEELKRRLASLPPFEIKVKSGYLKRYAEKVTSASKGAVFED
jgi:dihydroxy-acid dehydratase